ncbi:hypothetical protein EV182_005004 [Spiromyces aspiralis]|uniref:Uncharacterized protein n=1 Tax=Spiromyces aspiralis TaxID=68401 RepID=A0ACC1HE73_9FUNG|nr:hypothetical protein EV182_005004 [Spiromyces aspiralis]
MTVVASSLASTGNDSSRQVLKLIVAAAQNNGIGRKGTLPWTLKSEMAYFTKMTRTVRLPAALRGLQVANDSGGDVCISMDGTEKRVLNACIMGRHSWESIPLRYRPLNHRYNIVLTSNPGLLAGETSPLVARAADLRDALSHIEHINSDPATGIFINDVFVIGGHAVYKAAMHSPNPVEIFMTRVQFSEADTCDVFFPEIPKDSFTHQSFAELQARVPFKVQEGKLTEDNLEYEHQLFTKP